MATAEHAIFARRPTPRFPSLAKDSAISCSFPAKDGALSISGCCGGGGGGEDRISRLADELLSNIVARLPVKDAVRTSVLSLRWRRVWASTPLVLDDADLLPDLPDDGGCGFVGTNSRTIADAVSCVLASHQGPFRFIRLTYCCNYAAAHDDGALVRCWLGVLAAKGVEDLVLLDRLRPGATNASLPADVLRISSLRRLDLGHWEFPGTENLCRDADVFPYLRELGLCKIDIGAADIDRLFRYSPVLEKVALIASDNTPPVVLIRSQSLRCVLFWKSIARKLHVLVAPMLERLVLWNKCPDARLGHDVRTKLSIGCAPKPKVLGYLDPRIHLLELLNTVIEAETTPSPYPLPMVPSVKILALKVRFGVRVEADMVPIYLRCFPNVETLHVMSDEADEPIGKLNFEVWQEAGPIDCLELTLEKFVLRNFRGDQGELEFFMFVWERSKVLKKMVVVLADGSSMEEVLAKLRCHVCASAKPASKGRRPMIMVRTGGTTWSFHTASDLAVSDPFDF